MQKTVTLLKRIFFYFWLISLLLAMIKIARLGVVIYLGEESKFPFLVQEAAELFVISIVWLILFLVMKSIEFLVIGKANNVKNVADDISEPMAIKEFNVGTATKPRTGASERELSDYINDEEYLNRALRHVEVHHQLKTSTEPSSTAPKPAIQNRPKSEIEIIKRGKFKQYSVADELTKWAKLMKDGHISQDEFNEAKMKLLNKSLK